MIALDQSTDSERVFCGRAEFLEHGDTGPWVAIKEQHPLSSCTLHYRHLRRPRIDTNSKPFTVHYRSSQTINSQAGMLHKHELAEVLALKRGLVTKSNLRCTYST